MKSHLTAESAQKMIGDKMQETVKRVSDVSFMNGAYAISKMILAQYMPAIESAKNAKERTEAINNLKVFLGKADKLFPKQTEKEAKPDENSESI
jgi:predicted DNA-binding helix-hairpin-helix protein